MRLIAEALILGLVAAAPGTDSEQTVPAWLFPSNSTLDAPLAVDPEERVSFRGSRVSYRRSQLTDLHLAVDWHPDEHEPMPKVVARGRGEDTYACGYCHTPTGQGRPENAVLAGLPPAYIEEQVDAFRTGTRRSAWHGAYRPADLMRRTVEHLSHEDLVQAAEYFSRQKLHSRVRVMEVSHVPRWHVIGLVYTALPDGGMEELGGRLMEFSASAADHEMRDDRMQYVAYVPIGSIARGSAIASGEIEGGANACVSCHGAQLKGLGAAPPLAGRSPTYLLRSLFAFRDGRRTGASAAQMAQVAGSLDERDLIAVAAYAASLRP